MYPQKGQTMDKKIRAISKKVAKDAKSEEEELATLARMDKKRDKVCEMGEKMKKKGKR